MACGAPVVASAIGGITDHVAHGQTGLLVPAGSPEDLAAALRTLLADPERARRLGREAARYARAAVDWDVLVPRIRGEVYRAALAPGPTTRAGPKTA
jgi:glycosyltransferase involved in cell wall biosynthesis